MTLLPHGTVREDGRILTGYTSVKGKKYPQWRKPEDVLRRAEKAKERQRICNIHPEKVNEVRSRAAMKNKIRRIVSSERINSLRRLSYEEQKAAVLTRNAAWRKKNWEKVLASRRLPQYAIASKLRSRVLSAVRSQGGKKAGSTMKLVGCSTSELISHLEGQFQPGMTWENHGSWHIDHKKPCASFNLVDPEEQRRCFHFSNLQPLWGVDNLKKGSKIYFLTK